MRGKAGTARARALSGAGRPFGRTMPSAPTLAWRGPTVKIRRWTGVEPPEERRTAAATSTGAHHLARWRTRQNPAAGAGQPAADPHAACRAQSDCRTGGEDRVHGLSVVFEPGASIPAGFTQAGRRPFVSKHEAGQGDQGCFLRSTQPAQGHRASCETPASFPRAVKRHS